MDVLFVEDDPLLRMLAEGVFQELGHPVVTCDCAEGALEWLEHRHFDVLLTDISLPGISGIELARQVRAHNPALGIVLVSGHWVDTDELGLPGALALLKPYDIDQLRQLLSHLPAAPEQTLVDW